MNVRQQRQAGLVADLPQLAEPRLYSRPPLGAGVGAIRLVEARLEDHAARHEVRVGGRLVELTPREFEILRVLLGEQGRIVTKGKLLRAVWGQAYQGEDSYVYVHVSQLRHKLAAADPSGTLSDLIVTEPGIGYRVREPESAPLKASRAKT